MTGRFILYHTGFYSLPNEVACCNRITGDSLKLLGLIVNRVKVANAQLPTTVAMSRLLLKRVFGNKDDKTIKNYAKRLKELGFINSYSLQGGDGGEFVFAIDDYPENNPFVLLSRIENEVIALTVLQSGKDADSLLEAFTAAVQAVEQDYAARLMNVTESGCEKILTAYRSYLSEKLQADGASVGTRLVKPKTNKVKPLPTETVFPEDVQSWSLSDFVNYFLQEYTKVTGRKHITRNRKGKTVEDCIKDLQHHYRDHEKSERRPTMKRHIEAFFVNYPLTGTNTPTAFLLADGEALYNVEHYLETGKKHVLYEERSFKSKKSMSQAEIKAQQAREAKQENKGMTFEQLKERMEGRANRR